VHVPCAGEPTPGPDPVQVPATPDQSAAGTGLVPLPTRLAGSAVVETLTVATRPVAWSVASSAAVSESGRSSNGPPSPNTLALAHYVPLQAGDSTTAALAHMTTNVFAKPPTPTLPSGGHGQAQTASSGATRLLALLAAIPEDSGLCGGSADGSSGSTRSADRPLWTHHPVPEPAPVLEAKAVATATAALADDGAADTDAARTATGGSIHEGSLVAEGSGASGTSGTSTGSGASGGAPHAGPSQGLGPTANASNRRGWTPRIGMARLGAALFPSVTSSLSPPPQQPPAASSHSPVGLSHLPPPGAWKTYKEPTIRVSVIDEGPGIADADRELLFKPFNQIRSGAGLKPTTGTGLGLAICRRIMELSGGYIDVHSTEGAGAMFYFEVSARGARTGSTLRVHSLTTPHPYDRRCHGVVHPPALPVRRWRSMCLGWLTHLQHRPPRWRHQLQLWRSQQDSQALGWQLRPLTPLHQQLALVARFHRQGAVNNLHLPRCGPHWWVGVHLAWRAGQTAAHHLPSPHPHRGRRRRHRPCPPARSVSFPC